MAVEIWHGPYTGGTVGYPAFERSLRRLVPVRPPDRAGGVAPLNAVRVPADPLGWNARARNPLTVAMERLNQLSRLPDDWDGFGSRPPSERAIQTAGRVIGLVHRAFQLVSPEAAVPLAIVPVSGGGVQVEWRGISGDVEVEIEHDGAMSCLAVRGEPGRRRYLEEPEASDDQVLRAVESMLLPPSA